MKSPHALEGVDSSIIRQTLESFISFLEENKSVFGEKTLKQLMDEHSTSPSMRNVKNDQVTSFVRALENQCCVITPLLSLGGNALIQSLKDSYEDAFGEVKISTQNQARDILTPTAEQAAFGKWIDTYPDYARKHNIENNISVSERGVEYKDENGKTIILPFGQRENKVKFSDIENEEGYPSMKELGRLLTLLGGNYQSEKEHAIQSKEMASFLHEVLDWKYNSFTWSSDGIDDNYAWVIKLRETGLYIDFQERRNSLSAISSKN